MDTKSHFMRPDRVAFFPGVSRPIWCTPTKRLDSWGLCSRPNLDHTGVAHCFRQPWRLRTASMANRRQLP